MGEEKITNTYFFLKRHKLQEQKINMHSQIITQGECKAQTKGPGTQKKRKCDKVSRKKGKEPESLSDGTTKDEMEVMKNDSADFSFTLNKDESEL